VTQVVFLLAERLHLLDVAGPAQVFSTASDLGLDYRMHFVGERSDVATAQGLPLRAELDWPDLGLRDIVLVPGWRMRGGGRPERFGTPFLDRLAAHHRTGGTVASVCAGAFALAAAGLLDGRRCTTHHDLQDELARRYPAAQVVRDVLYTIDAGVVTSAGIASGVDLALHLLALRHGPGLAAKAAREMVVYSRRNESVASWRSCWSCLGLTEKVHRAFPWPDV
jgi:transcriptional regulator GlxA family with amidase domain